MKQFKFEYTGAEVFNNKLGEFKIWCDSNNILKMMFQVYSEVLETDTLDEVCSFIRQIFPETLYMGCSTSGNIIDCQLSSVITVVCTVFEFESTQFSISQYDLTSEPIENITAQIVEKTRTSS